MTGGSRGIGACTVAKLLEQLDVVYVLDKHVERSSTERIKNIQLDVTDAISVNEAVQSIFDVHQQVDVLVNNAGVTARAFQMWQTPLELFETMWRVHFLGTVHTCQAVLPYMIQRGYGRIVNVASVAGKEGNIGSSAYSSAKAAVIALTKSLGKELATTGVLVNAVTPGIIDTPLLADSNPEHINRLLQKIPMSRPGRPEEVAEMIAWLASEKCSFTTGSVVDISGGRTTY